MKKYSNENLIAIASLIIKAFNNNIWQYRYLEDNHYEILFTRMKSNEGTLTDDIRLTIYGKGKIVGYVNIIKKDGIHQYTEDEIRDDVDDLLAMISLSPDTYYATLEY